VDSSVPGGVLYVPADNAWIYRYTADGSFLGSWAVPEAIRHVAVAPAPRRDVFGVGRDTVYRWAPTGSLVTSWSAEGGGGSYSLCGLDVGADGVVYVTRASEPAFVKYYTPRGAFLGSFPYTGTYAHDVAVTDDGRRAYVIEVGWVRYFDRVETTVAPASLGKVKALFR